MQEIDLRYFSIALFPLGVIFFIQNHTKKDIIALKKQKSTGGLSLTGD